MKCGKCKYGDITVFDHCYCFLFGVKIYQHPAVECCSFTPKYLAAGDDNAKM